MSKKLFVVVAAMLCAGSVLRAQEPCGTDKKYWDLVKQKPQILEYERAFEEQIQNSINDALRNKTTLTATDTAYFDIPIVIHVVHDYGAEYLADNDIYDAVKYWSEVFQAQNTDTAYVIAPFKKYIGNARIRLHLATIDPRGKPTKGVVRHMSYLTGNADDDAKYFGWPNNKYINIWFIRTFGAASTGAAAYAYYPSTAAFIPNYDGVISLYTYLNYAKAIPHEIGHVLNLQHVWGNNNSPGTVCGNDGVDDTPPTKGHNPVGCVASALYDTACATGYMRNYTTSAGVDSVENYPDTVNSQNIMDYTYCQQMFSKGQVVRMRTALLSSTAGRNNLSTAANLAATGAMAAMPDLPPVAEFIVDRGVGGTFATDTRSYFLTFNNSNSFSFTDHSWNDTITSLKWQFSNGATTPNSTASAVLNKFSVPGWVTATLTATSNAGSDTLVNTHAVYAADTTAVSPTGFSQHFATPASIDNWPMINFYNNQYKWEYVTGASADGDNSCVRFRSFDTTNKVFGTPAGDHDDFYTPAFNLNGITGKFYLNFYTAAAKTSNPGGGTPAVGDSLQIDVSTTGGARWTRIGGLSGNNLVNNGVKNTEYKPTLPAQRKPQALNIPDVYRTGNTFFRFRYWPGNTGNNFYMDNVYMFPFPTSVDESVVAAGTFSVYPNPSSEGFNLVFRNGNEGNVHLLIKDIAGRVIYEDQKTYTPGTTAQENLPKSLLPTPGMYLITVIIDGASRTEKLIVY
ncbi:MAG: T9SS type A sorting domain-containing protein [Taibaiella sp.]|nr:T9SS type A sorting domain-containing protein [Taibaiella sp.]